VQIRRQFYGFSTIRKILDKILEFADGTERCEIRWDSCAMGGNKLESPRRVHNGDAVYYGCNGWRLASISITIWPETR
jgi:hypothetical protein